MPNRRLFWSRSMYEMLGMPPQSSVLSFGDAARLMHPDDGGIYKVARTIAKGDARQIDQIFRMRHADGHYVWMRARAQVIRTASGRVHLIGIAMDVTEQHRLAQRYAEADQRLADAIECTSEAFVLWDKNDRLVMCNTPLSAGLQAARPGPGCRYGAFRGQRRFRPSDHRAAHRRSRPVESVADVAKCNLPTSAGCRSMTGEPAMAALCPWAPTLRC